MTAGAPRKRGQPVSLIGVVAGPLATVTLAGLTACASTTSGAGPTSGSPSTATSTTTTAVSSPATTSPDIPDTSTSTAHASATPAADPVDPRWRFFTSDTGTFTSPWFSGSHRIMVPFGCTSAPYYDHDSRCPGTQGFHHGVDVAMPCGPPLTSTAAGVVANPGGTGARGAAYGPYAFRIRDPERVVGRGSMAYGWPALRDAYQRLLG